VLARTGTRFRPPGPRPCSSSSRTTRPARPPGLRAPEAVVHAAAIGQFPTAWPGAARGGAPRQRGPPRHPRPAVPRARPALVAHSTDLVFGGDRAFLRRGRPAGPARLYGRTKLAGEDGRARGLPLRRRRPVALDARPRPRRPGHVAESVAWASARAARPALHGRVTGTPSTPSRWPTRWAPSRARRLGSASTSGARADQPARARPEGGAGPRPAGVPDHRGLQSDHAGPDAARRRRVADSTRARREASAGRRVRSTRPSARAAEPGG